MNYKNTLCSMLLFFSAIAFILPLGLGNSVPVRKWIISKTSSLTVSGSTNVNKFSCVIPTYDQKDTLRLSKSNADNEIVFSGNITLAINGFDCHNSGMTKQLRKTLDEKEFPALQIKFLSLNKFPVLTSKPELITGLVEIEIAGVSKRFDVNYQLTQDDQKNIHLLGTRNVNFSDFNLVPPKKLGGMIKTKDQLNVNFQLNMRVMN